MLGNGRCECYCFDGKNRLAHIRGKMRKKVWVSAVSPLSPASEPSESAGVSYCCGAVVVVIGGRADGRTDGWGALLILLLD